MAFRRFKEYFKENAAILEVSLMGFGYVATNTKLIEYRVKHNIGKKRTPEEAARKSAIPNVAQSLPIER
jgi:hypothetical protein